VAKILIIEPDRETGERMAQDLRTAGHKCLVEASAERVERIATKNTVDLFVTEAMLPGMSGFEMCRRIRRHPDLYTAPVMVISHMADEEEVQHGLAQGADDYMGKPFQVAELVHRVDALIDTGADCLVPDKVTGLPNAKLVRRELQRRISAQDGFALVYVEMMYLRAFGERYGAAARDKAIGWLGQTLQQCAEQQSASAHHFLGHTGSGCFVCTLGLEEARPHCETVQTFYKDHLDALYDSMGLSHAYKAAQAQAPEARATPLLDILLCVTDYEGQTAATPRELFETLNRLRQKGLAEERGGTHVNRRKDRDRRRGRERRLRDGRRLQEDERRLQEDERREPPD